MMFLGYVGSAGEDRLTAWLFSCESASTPEEVQ